MRYTDDLSNSEDNARDNYNTIVARSGMVVKLKLGRERQISAYHRKKHGVIRPEIGIGIFNDNVDANQTTINHHELPGITRPIIAPAFWAIGLLVQLFQRCRDRDGVSDREEWIVHRGP